MAKLRGAAGGEGLALDLTDAARAHVDRATGTTPTSGPGRSSGCSSARSPTRSRSKLLKGEFRDGDTILVDAKPDGLVFTKGEPARVG